MFGRMTVWENLVMGAYRATQRAPGRASIATWSGSSACSRACASAQTQYAGTMSGGEQQMLAIGRALMARPRLLLMDEPSMGLSPAFVDQVFDIIQEINRQGTTILVVEQNAGVALSIAHRGYVLQNGRIVIADDAAALLEADESARLSGRGLTTHGDHHLPSCPSSSSSASRWAPSTG